MNPTTPAQPGAKPANASVASGKSKGGSQRFRPTLWPTIIYFLGMVALFLSERVLDAGQPQNVALVVGVAFLLGAIAFRLARHAAQPVAFRAPERLLLGLYLVGFVAVLMHFANSDLMLRVVDRPLEQTLPRLSGALAALWPALWLAGVLPILFVEMSLWSMTRAPVLELGRVRSALLSGLGIAFALVFAFGATYIATERNARMDFSYFRTARPGDSTKKIVQALDKPVHVHLFFPPANEVREEVEGYFTELARESKLLEVERWDFALHPAKARELGVSGNGAVVIARDALKEQIGIPVELGTARAQLKRLDEEVQKRILGVTRKQQIAYFTVGHDERAEKPSGEEDRRGTVSTLRRILVDLSFEPRNLGLGEGLGREVPKDASVVLILGPRQPFFDEEIASLKRYLDNNGRLLIALDPDGGQTLETLLGPLSLDYEPVTLASDSAFWPVTYQPSDRTNIITFTYSSHVSVTTNSRFGSRTPLLMLGAGHLTKQDKTAAGIVNLDFTVRSGNTTWNDLDADFEFDSDTEVRTVYNLAAAVTKRNASAIDPEDEARVVVLSDSDCLTDLVLGRSRGNAFLAVDALRWLGGEERFAGAISNEEDVPVAHTRKQDLLWFYLSIFAIPGLVLGLGFVMTRRKRGRPRPKDAPGKNADSGESP